MAEPKGFAKLKWYYQILTVAAISGALLAAVWYQFLAPIEDQIRVKQGQVNDLNIQIAKTLQQKAIFEQFKKDTEELGRRLEALKAVLPLQKETDQIMRMVETGARLAGLQVKRIAVRPLVDHEIYTEWPWDLEVVGTYPHIESFLDRVRQIPRIVNISNMRITSRASEGELAFTASVGATFAATTFIYHEEAPAPAPPAKPGR